MTVYKITSAEQAESILRFMGSHRGPIKSGFVFDIHEGPECIAEDVPLVYRVCEMKCTADGKPVEYVGPNIWGNRFEKRSTYCPSCGNVLKSRAEAAIAISGERVINTNYRWKEGF